VRMGRGMMMGVDHNRNLEWVGGSAALWVEWGDHSLAAWCSRNQNSPCHPERAAAFAASRRAPILPVPL